MILYHGSSVIVDKPDVLHSFRALDFGKGFYLTSVYEQAAKWARRKSELTGANRAIINKYDMAEDTSRFKVKLFGENLSDWIDFVCQCRDGADDYLKYDIIYGKVADDKVFRVVDMYKNGIWDKERALSEIKVYPNYDQYAYITQSAIDELLEFKGFDEV